MDKTHITDILNTLLEAGENDQADRVLMLALEHTQIKACYLQLLDILHRPTRDDLSGAYDNLAKRFEELQAEHAEAMAAQQQSNPRHLGLEALYVSQRTIDALYEEGILNVGQLLGHTHTQLLKIPNIGPKQVRSITDGLTRLGLGLSQMDVSTSPGAAVS